MRLEDCNFDVDRVATHPLRPTAPEEIWTTARDVGDVPDALFRLYCSASYLAFGAEPRFLSDPEHVLFSYFAMLMRGLRDTLVESRELAHEVEEAESKTYDPGKLARGEPWDPKASVTFLRAFRNLAASTSGALDVVAELVALLLTGRVPGLRVGRASFTTLASWLGEPFSAGRLIVTPQDHHLEELHRRLGPAVHATGSEADWLALLLLYRNKSLHLGSHMFLTFKLHDREGKFHPFLPRQWPFIRERFIAPADPSKPPEPRSTRELLEDSLVHQDAVAFAWGLQRKVLSAVSLAAEVLLAAYNAFAGFEPNSAALAELEGSTVRLRFLAFDDAAG